MANQQFLITDIFKPADAAGGSFEPQGEKIVGVTGAGSLAFTQPYPTGSRLDNTTPLSVSFEGDISDITEANDGSISATTWFAAVDNTATSYPDGQTTSVTMSNTDSILGNVLCGTVGATFIEGSVRATRYNSAGADVSSRLDNAVFNIYKRDAANVDTLMGTVALPSVDGAGGAATTTVPFSLVAVGGSTFSATDTVFIEYTYDFTATAITTANAGTGGVSVRVNFDKVQLIHA